MAILIVDDTRSVRALMEYHLQGAGLGPVVHAATAHECYKRLGLEGTQGTQEAQGDVSLVLMDLRLPDASGIEALGRIKAAPGLRGLRVLLSTSDLRPADREAALAAGADGFVHKPLDRDDFVARVSEALAAS